MSSGTNKCSSMDSPLPLGRSSWAAATTSGSVSGLLLPVVAQLASVRQIRAKKKREVTKAPDFCYGSLLCGLGAVGQVKNP